MSGEVAVRQFIPTTLDDRKEYAKLLATSDLLPRALQDRPANVLLIMEYGDSLGIPYSQAISTIGVIDGKPTASAALISALVRRAGHKLRVKGDDHSATATITRSDDPEPFEVTFTIDDAVRAGLCTLRDGKPYARSKTGKPLPWETYTPSMLKARAVTQCARDACQEALMGIQYTAEELGVVVDEFGNPVDGPGRAVQRVEATVVAVAEEPAPQPEPAKEPTPEPEVVEAVPEPEASAPEQQPEPEPEPAPEPVDEQPEPEPALTDEMDEADWVQQWHNQFDAACTSFNMTEMAALARAAGDRGRTDLVAHSRAKWREVAQAYKAEHGGAE